MPRRRKSSSLEGNYSAEDTLDKDTDLNVDEDTNEELNTVDEPAESDPYEVEASVVTESVEESESIPPLTESEDEPQELLPPADVVVIDVEAGAKTKRPSAPKPKVKVKNDHPKLKPTPMPKRNLPRFVRK